jgi:hypothetical protein
MENMQSCFMLCWNQHYMCCSRKVQVAAYTANQLTRTNWILVTTYAFLPSGSWFRWLARINHKVPLVMQRQHGRHRAHTCQFSTHYHPRLFCCYSPANLKGRCPGAYSPKSQAYLHTVFCCANSMFILLFHSLFNCINHESPRYLS